MAAPRAVMCAIAAGRSRPRSRTGTASPRRSARTVVPSGRPAPAGSGARQWTTTDPPGFLWLGRAALAPGVDVVVRDAFRNGRGRSAVALWGVLPLGRASGAGIDEASLQRWLGDEIHVQALEVTSYDSTLRVILQYVVLRSGETRVDTFERSGP